MRIFILGPSRWRRDGPRAGAAISPLDLRRRLAQVARRAGARAIIMEDAHQGGDETHATLFGRLLDAHPETCVAVLWPAGAVRTGLDVEIGMILQRCHDRRVPRIWLFVEEQAGREKHGRFIGREQGVRTRYYEDLLTFGADLVVWEDLAHLEVYLEAAVRDRLDFDDPTP